MRASPAVSGTVDLPRDENSRNTEDGGEENEAQGEHRGHENRHDHSENAACFEPRDPCPWPESPAAVRDVGKDAHADQMNRNRDSSS